MHTIEQAGPPASAGVLLSQIDVALKRLADKHWAQVRETMKRQGFDPADGGMIVFPAAEEEKAPGHRPAWVAFSSSADKPVLINPRRQGVMP